MVVEKIEMVLIDAPDGVVITEERTIYEAQIKANGFLQGRLNLVDKHYKPNF